VPSAGGKTSAAFEKVVEKVTAVKKTKTKTNETFMVTSWIFKLQVPLKESFIEINPYMKMDGSEII
jgi:hypothetical protein